MITFNLLQYPCLENPMDRGVWQATVHGVARVGHDLVTKTNHHISMKSSSQVRRLWLMGLTQMEGLARQWYSTEWWFGTFLNFRLPKSQLWILHTSQLWCKRVSLDLSLHPPSSYWGHNSINLKGLLHWLNEIMEIQLTVCTLNES